MGHGPFLPEIVAQHTREAGRSGSRDLSPGGSRQPILARTRNVHRWFLMSMSDGIEVLDSPVCVSSRAKPGTWLLFCHRCRVGWMGLGLSADCTCLFKGYPFATGPSRKAHFSRYTCKNESFLCAENRFAPPPRRSGCSRHRKCLENRSIATVALVPATLVVLRPAPPTPTGITSLP